MVPFTLCQDEMVTALSRNLSRLSQPGSYCVGLIATAELLPPTIDAAPVFCWILLPSVSQNEHRRPDNATDDAIENWQLRAVRICILDCRAKRAGWSLSPLVEREPPKP